MGTGGPTYADLSAAPAVACVAFEPEEESPIVFLPAAPGRPHRHEGVASRAVEHARGAQDPGRAAARPVPGAEAAALSELSDDVVAALSEKPAAILVGERAAEVPGLYSAAAALAARTGAALGWVPRRAGERGALEAGAAPNLLPGGRLVSDEAARAEVARAWGVPEDSLPADPGRDTEAMLAAAGLGELGALLVAGLDPGDLADPQAAITALREVGFLVSLEMRASPVTELADVVLPVAPDAHRAGSYLNWEGRSRAFGASLDAAGMLPDCRVLDTLAIEMDVDLFTQTPAAAAGELARLGRTEVDRTARTSPTVAAVSPVYGQAILATWRQLLDAGSLQDNEPELAGTAREPRLRVNEATAKRLGLVEGEPATARTERGAITLPVALADLPDGVVWLPGNAPDSRVRGTLGVGHGAVVGVTAGGAP